MNRYSSSQSFHPNFSFKDKLMDILLEICYKIQAKTSMKLNLSNKIRNWIYSIHNQEPTFLLNQLRIFLLACIDEILWKNKNESLNKSASSQLTRIKSQQRILLKVLKRNETAIDNSAYHAKQQETKDKIIHDLKEENKKLEKKLLSIIAQFNQIKKQYELKIEQYRKILNNSLVNFQKQVQQQLYGPPYPEINLNSYRNVEMDEIVQTNVLKTPKNHSTKRISQCYEEQKKTKQVETNKYMTIPTIPYLELSNLRNKDSSSKKHSFN